MDSKTVTRLCSLKQCQIIFFRNVNFHPNFTVHGLPSSGNPLTQSETEVIIVRTALYNLWNMVPWFITSQNTMYYGGKPEPTLFTIRYTS